MTEACLEGRTGHRSIVGKARSSDEHTSAVRPSEANPDVQYPQAGLRLPERGRGPVVEATLPQKSSTASGRRASGRAHPALLCRVKNAGFTRSRR